MPSTKAVHLKSFRKFVLERADADAYQRILAALDPADRQVVEQPVLSTQWVDYFLWWRLLCAADRVLGSGDYRIVRAVGAFDAAENLQGIYRAFLKLTNVKTLVSQSGLIWRRYYDTGLMQVARLEAGSAELRLSQFPGLPLHHEEEIIGWMETALKMTGARSVILSHDQCLARGDAYCRFWIKWEQ